MPRGNLETIEPLALTLAFLRKAIDEKRFKEAFTAMRRNRINLNLLYDHNPVQFKANLPEFIQQIDSVDFINLFIADLR